MEHGHDRQHFVAGTEHGICCNNLHCKRVEIAVGQDNSLHNAGCPAAVQNNGWIIRFFGNLIFPMIVNTELDERVPRQNGRIFWNFFNFSTVCQHISGAYMRRKLVLDGRQNYMLQFDVLANGLKFVIELIQCESKDAVRFFDEEFDFVLTGQRMHHIRSATDQINCIK